MEEETDGRAAIHCRALHNLKVHLDGWPVTPSPMPPTRNEFRKPVDDELL